jgi:tetratricopeptide (TPR) repeat protein
MGLFAVDPRSLSDRVTIGHGFAIVDVRRHDASPMTDARTLVNQADQAAAAGQFAAARALLEQAVEADSPTVDLWMKLSAMRKAAGDLSGALAAVDRALALSPLDFSALLSRAVILDRLGDPNAGEEFGNALAQLPLDEDVPESMKPAVDYARKRRDEFRASLEARLVAALPADLAPSDRSRAERFISNRARRTRHYHQEPTDFHFPGVPEIEFHDLSQFAGIRALEAATSEIRAEFEALIAAEAAEMVPYIQYPDRVPMRQWKALNHNRDWTAVHLLQNGRRVEANARHCPKTLAAIAAMDQPQIPGASPNAMFSLLAPRTRIPPHTGVANTRLVCHLPLIVPADCGFRCGATTREWRVGEAFVFDDTIEHEAWNDSVELRVVLIIVLWQPGLSEADRHAVAAVIGASGATFMGKA